LPIITQYWFGGTVAMTLLGNFGVINPMYMIWSWHGVKSKFELWRVLTSFCYAGPFAFDTLITICKYGTDIGLFFSLYTQRI
jgi:Derlin-2/3